ncbi:MAG: alkaline phosphatase family protein [Bacteroidales bacterium]|nr:alkaline phosphatase family protein [Bacteroidales bacterium]
MSSLILLNCVGLTSRLLPHAPRLAKLAAAGWSLPLREVTPAVTCSAQATILTGEPVNVHGIVANGWLFRDTNEVRFWQQSNRLIQAEPLYVTAQKRAAARGVPFTSAKLFWWFNQGAAVDYAVTPKPWYGIDGNKIFGIAGTPPSLAEELTRQHGPFPFATFWGPMAGKACTEWIAAATSTVIQNLAPRLCLAYLPHLDYDPQRFGPAGTDMARCVRELDEAVAPILDTADRVGAQVWVVSEYGHCDVSWPIYPNRVLRNAGLIAVRDGPFGEQLDLYASRAFAVCDHQIAHVYVPHPTDVPRVRDLLAALPGVDRLLIGEERAEWQLDHPRSGEIILLPQREAWFAYPYWLDDRTAPDYARSVAIHHKPGYDPCELFFDPRFRFPKLHAARRLLQKKLGFRTRFDVVPLDASLVRGSHGLPAADPVDAALLIGHGPRPTTDTLPMTAVKERILQALDLGA